MAVCFVFIFSKVSGYLRFGRVRRFSFPIFPIGRCPKNRQVESARPDRHAPGRPRNDLQKIPWQVLVIVTPFTESLAWIAPSDRIGERGDIQQPRQASKLQNGNVLDLFQALLGAIASEGGLADLPAHLVSKIIEGTVHFFN